MSFATVGVCVALAAAQRVSVSGTDAERDGYETDASGREPDRLGRA